MGLFYLAIKIPQTITITLFANIAYHLLSLILSTLSLFKSPPDPDDYSAASDGGSYLLILDGSSPSLLPVPVHVVTASIKNKVPVVPYSEFAARSETAAAVCSVCLEGIDGGDLIRELLNCRHVFHRECLDRWVDEGQVTCPLCRSMLLPNRKLLCSAGVDVAVPAEVGPVT